MASSRATDRAGRHPATAAVLLTMIAACLGIVVAAGPAAFVWTLGDSME